MIMDISDILRLANNNPDLVKKALEDAGIEMPLLLNEMQTLANLATAASEIGRAHV